VSYGFVVVVLIIVDIFHDYLSCTRRRLIPRLEARLWEVNMRRERELLEIQEEMEARKVRLQERAEERIRNRRVKESTVDIQSQQIDTLRKENAKIRANNQQLHANCANLRTNNNRLEETIQSGEEYFKQLEIHHSRCLTDNQKLTKFDDLYRKKLEEMEETVESRTAWAQYEHKIKRAYARALWCAVEMVRDTNDESLLSTVQELTTMLEGHTQSWVNCPFDDYRPRRNKKKAEKLPPPPEMEDADIELSPGMLDLVKRNKKLTQLPASKNKSVEETSESTTTDRIRTIRKAASKKNVLKDSKSPVKPSKPKVYIDDDSNSSDNGTSKSKKNGKKSNPSKAFMNAASKSMSHIFMPKPRKSRHSDNDVSSDDDDDNVSNSSNDKKVAIKSKTNSISSKPAWNKSKSTNQIVQKTASRSASRHSDNDLSSDSDSS
jgi:hypothetical protein